MNKTIVSIVSEQTAPNVLFIKENGDCERHIFLTTNRMEDRCKTEMILKACGLDVSKTERVTFPDNDFDGMEAALSGLSFGAEEKVLLNLTGGTKLMTLAVYGFFTSRFSENRLEIYYLALGRNTCARIYPAPRETRLLLTRLTLQDYMSAYGVEIRCRNRFAGTKEIRERLMREGFEKNRAEISTLVKFQNDARRMFQNKGFVNMDEERCRQILTREAGPTGHERVFGFLREYGYNPLHFLKEECRFLTGRWFEELIFERLRDKTGLGESRLSMNVEIFRREFKNEFDVVFIHGNTLHIIECKTGFGEGGAILQDAVYKQRALRQELGLDVRSHLVSAESVTNEHHLKMAKVFDINLCHGESVRDPDIFEREFIKPIFG